MKKGRGTYPSPENPCLACGKVIIIKTYRAYLLMKYRPRKFCDTSCRTVYANKTKVWTDRERQILADTAKKTFTGRKWTDEHRRKLAKAISGDKSHRWQGGLTAENRKLRNSVEVSIWRDKVFQRDNYTCQECGLRSGNGKAVQLNADHIKPWALYPDLRFDVENGRTLCLSCHIKTPTFGIKTRHQGNYLTEAGN